MRPRDDIAEKTNRITKATANELESLNEKIYGKFFYILNGRGPESQCSVRIWVQIPLMSLRGSKISRVSPGQHENLRHLEENYVRNIKHDRAEE